MEFKENNEINEFRCITAKRFHSINGISAEDIEDEIRTFAEEILLENEIEAQVGEAVVYGSRARGLETSASDIDVVIEIDSDIKEDSLFNILNEEEYTIEGIKVDINPIRKEESGTLSEYLKRAEKYLAEKEKITKINKTDVDFDNR